MESDEAGEGFVGAGGNVSVFDAVEGTGAMSVVAGGAAFEVDAGGAGTTAFDVDTAGGGEGGSDVGACA